MDNTNKKIDDSHVSKPVPKRPDNCSQKDDDEESLGMSGPVENLQNDAVSLSMGNTGVNGTNFTDADGHGYVENESTQEKGNSETDEIGFLDREDSPKPEDENTAVEMKIGTTKVEAETDQHCTSDIEVEGFTSSPNSASIRYNNGEASAVQPEDSCEEDGNRTEPETTENPVIQTAANEFLGNVRPARVAWILFSNYLMLVVDYTTLCTYMKGPTNSCREVVSYSPVIQVDFNLQRISRNIEFEEGMILVILYLLIRVRYIPRLYVGSQFLISLRRELKRGDCLAVLNRMLNASNCDGPDVVSLRSFRAKESKAAKKAWRKYQTSRKGKGKILWPRENNSHQNDEQMNNNREEGACDERPASDRLVAEAKQEKNDLSIDKAALKKENDDIRKKLLCVVEGCESLRNAVSISCGCLMFCFPCYQEKLSIKPGHCPYCGAILEFYHKIN